MAGVAGRVALVTGAGSAEGIGFACAIALAAAGAKVAITATSARIFDRASTLGARGFTADLTEPEQVTSLIREVSRALGPIAIIINNAGMVQQGKQSRPATLDKTSDEDWQHHLNINLTTAFNVTRAVLPAMRRKKYGRIVNIASVTGPLVSIARSGPYAAAKAAMTGLTRATALENARYGITCNAVLPGWIATASSAPAELRAGKATPAGRAGTPDEVAACALFLASEEASYVNGAMLVVDGANTIVEMKGAE